MRKPSQLTPGQIRWLSGKPPRNEQERDEDCAIRYFGWAEIDAAQMLEMAAQIGCPVDPKRREWLENLAESQRKAGLPHRRFMSRGA